MEKKNNPDKSCLRCVYHSDLGDIVRSCLIVKISLLQWAEFKLPFILKKEHMMLSHIYIYITLWSSKGLSKMENWGECFWMQHLPCFNFSIVFVKDMYLSSAIDQCSEGTCVVTEKSDRWEGPKGSEVRG